MPAYVRRDINSWARTCMHWEFERVGMYSTQAAKTTHVLFGVLVVCARPAKATAREKKWKLQEQVPRETARLHLLCSLRTIRTRRDNLSLLGSTLEVLVQVRSESNRCATYMFRPTAGRQPYFMYRHTRTLRVCSASEHVPKAASVQCSKGTHIIS